MSSDQPIWDCIQDMLKARAEALPAKQVLCYSLGLTSLTPRKVSYRMLYDEARRNSMIVSTLSSFKVGSPVVLRFDDHWDNILWFWTVLFAHGIPVLSSPLSNVEEHRNKHLQGLSQLLESPICITRTNYLRLFDGTNHSLQLYTAERLLSTADDSTTLHHMSNAHRPSTSKGKYVASIAETWKDFPAALMLTSGSTGNAKAVPLRHKQMLASIAGKASMRASPEYDACLNWIGLDHVAGLLETHLQALWLGVDQVHVHTADIVANPGLFLELLSRHRISRTFAPNFLLAKLVVTCTDNSLSSSKWNLSNLTCLVTGGEANDVQTCTAVSALLARYGTRPNVIAPGFGMTETCAGAIYNLKCPDYDVANRWTIASLGRCMPGIEMRVMVRETGHAAKTGQSGDLEVRGAVVFDGYYRNDLATAEAFTPDGWFRTGDQASVNSEGMLNLTGRIKDVININGVKIATTDLQTLLETTLRDTCATRVVVFPSRAPGAATEQVTVAYVPRDWPPQTEDMAMIERLTLQTCMMVSAACRPLAFPVGGRSLPFLPTSTLGKISGAKMRALFEAGTFDNDAAYHRQAVDEFKQKNRPVVEEKGLNGTETSLREDFAEIMGIENIECIDIDTPIFELGFTSMDVIRLKYRIDKRLKFPVDTILLLKHYTIKLLAKALDRLVSTAATTAPSHNTVKDISTELSVMPTVNYDPVITLCPTGTKTPLWLVHPGIGEVLVFVGLAQHLREDDRPIYALRARGFEPQQPKFASIAEAVDTYVAAVRRRQPQGPYAIAGYSYGAMLAFETAKKLECSEAQEVPFLGSFNLPPHIKKRMRQLSWNVCLIHLAQFLGLVDEACVDSEVSGTDGSSYCQASRDSALARILALVDKARMSELNLSLQDLARWADVSYGLQSMAIDYEPSGQAGSIDVFHAEPLRVAAASRDEWVCEQLSRWKDFCRTEPRFHEVGGAHYTMIDRAHVHTFSDTLRAALAARGL
ncbi:acetyl-CoA synthetase-like protein [Xylariaceae sp. FL0662B]|nr:acetyl-CoA synthetase-like protein [Xylariaceae sp. FL0662B]